MENLLLQRLRRQTHQVMDKIARSWDQLERKDFATQPERSQNPKLLSPEEDIKKLLITANTLDDIWQFLVKRLFTGASPNFVLFSVVDEVSEILRLRYLHPHDDTTPFQGEFIPLCDKENHFIRTVTRADTTFTDSLGELGTELSPYLEMVPQDNVKHNIFSVPLVAGDRVIAVITLGFHELDSFSQAKLSYVYLLRDQVALLVWNLILQERIQNQPQLDNLTGLITFSSFHHMLKKELRRAQFENHPLSLCLVDINDLNQYNTTYSPQMGDRAIAHLAFTIKHLVRGIDTLARFGSDEIALIIPESDTSHVRHTVEQIIQGIRQPHKTIKPFTVSIGVTTYPQDASDQEQLLKQVQHAAHFAKHQSHQTQQSHSVFFNQLGTTTDQERLAVFAEQLTQKHQSTTSELYEHLLARIEQHAPLTGGHSAFEPLAACYETIGQKNPYFVTHAKTVANYAVAIANALGLPASDIEKIRLAAFFHDIGHINLPDTILNKPSTLSSEEMALMRQHPSLSVQKLVQALPSLSDIAPMIEFHHEHWDGSGYPVGLKTENIPVGARIIAIADAFHALTSSQPQRAALPLDEAKVILQDGAGSLWDPELIGLFFTILETTQYGSLAFAEK